MNGTIDTAIHYYENYSPVGDVVVLGTCLVLLVLMKFAYNIKSKNYRILQWMIGCLMVAGMSNLTYHILLNTRDTVPVFWIYFFRELQHIGYFLNMFLYVIYTKEPLQLEERTRKIVTSMAGSGFLVVIGYDILGTIFKFGYHIDEAKNIHEAWGLIFGCGYVYFVGLLGFLVIYYRGRVVRQIVYGVIGTFVICFSIMILQGINGQSSFTTASFMFPVITLLYMIHSNPYNIEIGTVNISAFEEMIRFSHNKKQARMLMALFMPEFEGTGKHYPKKVQEIIRQFNQVYFKGSVLFQVSNGRMILVADMAKNPHIEESMHLMLDQFYEEYKRFQYDYKIVFMRTSAALSEKQDYLRMIRYMESKMEMNSFKMVEEKDYEEFAKRNYVLSQLEDIKKTSNLNDPRVVVYCQPVLNIATGKYDTAEALMRLILPGTGMVFPDVFIPLAEEHNLIHVLSEIILFKTCVRIKKLMGQGFNVQRISVNFTVSELKDPKFCDDIKRIITDVDIPKDKIAIEITESQNDSEFRIVKDRINELREDGIKFYLDDFGTGYSNFERIMELPFDIIKFDRSLVIACGSDEKSEKMVTHLARMFSAMDYSVLYEGIETDQDEEKCIRMSAKYLQGYKYSKPIPMDDLNKYFEKSAS